MRRSLGSCWVWVTMDWLIFTTSASEFLTLAPDTSSYLDALFTFTVPDVGALIETVLLKTRYHRLCAPMFSSGVSFPEHDSLRISSIFGSSKGHFRLAIFKEIAGSFKSSNALPSHPS